MGYDVTARIYIPVHHLLQKIDGLVEPVHTRPWLHAWILHGSSTPSVLICYDSASPIGSDLDDYSRTRPRNGSCLAVRGFPIVHNYLQQRNTEQMQQ
jgi:hypothetical protein